MLALILSVLCLAVQSEAFFLATSGRNVTKQLQVPNGAQWGDWRGANFCPQGQFAVGYDIKVEDYQFTGDDTALNGVRLICSDPSGANYGQTITSGTGPWGGWKGSVTCNQRPGTPMYLAAFSLEVETPQDFLDDSAATWIKFKCRDLQGRMALEDLNKDPGTGNTGQYGAWSQTCDNGSAVCGINTKVEGEVGSGDDTALNDVIIYCCDMNDPGSFIG